MFVAEGIVNFQHDAYQFLLVILSGPGFTPGVT